MSRPADHLPQSIGPYRILGTLGEGGMGTVYLAEQSVPVQRRVALKLIKLGMDSKAVLARFEQERQALAMMDHEGIARVHDCGTSERGQPWFAMELVKGIPLDQFCEQQKLSLHERIALMRQVCAAVQHAHQKGVVHRDLKPGNVLVADDGGRRQVKVIDFGLAKAMGRKLVEATLFTEAGQVVGTPEYMAPEQADPTNQDIDTRADVYSLGVMLYQLLCGELPFPAAELRRAGMLEVQRILREVDPVKPSSRVTGLGEGASALAQARRVSVSTLKKALSGDLDWVVLKALEKERNRRYETVTALSADLQRFLDHEPLEAGPPSAAYRLGKLLRRYRAQAATAAAVVITALAGAAFTLHYAFLAIERADQLVSRNHDLEQANQALEKSRREALANAEAAEAVTEFVEGALVNSDPNQGGAQGHRVVDAMDKAIRDLESGQVQLEPATQARLRRTIAHILNGNARSADALRLAEHALGLERRLHEGDHEDVAASLAKVGSCLDALGRSAEALPLYESALAMRQRLIEGDHLDIAAGINNIAYCLSLLGRFEEALPRYESALAMRQRLVGGDHPEVAAGLTNLGSCLQPLGRIREALERCEQALAMYRRLFPGDHPEVASSLNNVASCLQALGRTDEALAQYEQVLAMYRRLFPGDHPHVAICLNNVASCLEELGRSTEALVQHEAALAMYRRLFPGDHPEVASSLNNVGYCLESMGRSAEALASYEAALGMAQRLFPGDHPDVAASMNGVASCLDSLGRTAEALPGYEAVLAMRKRLFPGDHPHVANSINNVAFCLEALGRVGEALPQHEAALAMRKRVFGSEHQDVAASLNNVAMCLQALERSAEALPLHEQALAMRQKLFEGDHPFVALSLHNLAICLDSLGRSKEAVPTSERACEMMVRTLPEGHPWRTRSAATLERIRARAAGARDGR